LFIETCTCFIYLQQLLTSSVIWIADSTSPSSTCTVCKLNKSLVSKKWLKIIVLELYNKCIVLELYNKCIVLELYNKCIVLELY
jgi:hypothetical protein